MESRLKSLGDFFDELSWILLGFAFLVPAALLAYEGQHWLRYAEWLPQPGEDPALDKAVKARWARGQALVVAQQDNGAGFELQDQNFA